MSKNWNCWVKRNGKWVVDQKAVVRLEAHAKRLGYSDVGTYLAAQIRQSPVGAR